MTTSPVPSSRVIVSGLALNRPADTVRPNAQRDFITSFVIFIGRPLWLRRIELTMLLCATFLVLVGASYAGIIGAIAAVVLLTELTTIQWLDSKIRLALHRSSIHRRWDQACRFTLLVNANDRIPKINSIRSTKSADLLTVAMPMGMSFVPLSNATEALASSLGVRDVRVERDRSRADRATVTIVNADPLEDSAPIRWPLLSPHQLKKEDK